MLEPCAQLKAVLDESAIWGRGSPLLQQRWSWGVNPRKLKKCFQNPVFWCKGSYVPSCIINTKHKQQCYSANIHIEMKTMSAGTQGFTARAQAPAATPPPSWCRHWNRLTNPVHLLERQRHVTCTEQLPRDEIHRLKS